MLELSDLTEKRLAVALVSEDHDLITVDDLDGGHHNAEIEDADTMERNPDLWEIQVTYRSVTTDETGAFPNGTIVATAELSPGENDAYRNGMVVLFDELIDGHHVILEGDHGGAGVSDDSYEAHFIGTLSVVPEAASARLLSEAVGRHRREVMHDVHLDIGKINARLAGATADEMREGEVTKAFGALARIVARAA